MTNVSNRRIMLEFVTSKPSTIELETNKTGDKMKLIIIKYLVICDTDK